MLLMMVAGCQEEEKDLGRFQELYVVGESNSLPYNDSWQQLNRDSKEEISMDLVKYNHDGSYLIVDNKGNKMMGDEFERDQESEYSVSNELVEKIKNEPLFIVQEELYYVTTAEKEIMAMFDKKRKVSGKDLDKILEDNKEAYKRKDYQAINDYLTKEGITVWKSLVE